MTKPAAPAFATIIFDLDGTLIDSAPLCAAIVNQMLEQRGSRRAVTAADARDYLTKGGGQLIAALIGDDGGDPADDLAQFRTLYAARATPPGSLFPGVREGLDVLARNGARLAICSNKPQELCDKIVSDLALDTYFEVVVGSAAGLALKPAPDLARTALDRLTAEPGACLYIGDSEVDRQTAAAAGIPFLFVAYGYAERGQTIDAMARFERFDQFVDWVTAQRMVLPVRDRVA